MIHTELPYSPDKHLLTDSRQVSIPENGIFFAIKGERHDGHRFIPDLYQKGVRHFVVQADVISKEKLEELNSWPDTHIYVVPDSIQALQQVGKLHRSQFNLPVIGITGSNGKTVVKEWLAQMLMPAKKICASPKSYNSRIGVPLSVWNIRKEHELGIFEAGISLPMEMEVLQAIIDPEIGLFTNIGSAHNEGFKSLRQKVSEKLKLFVKSKKLIFRSDYQAITSEIDLLLKRVNPALELLSWSTNDQGRIRVKFNTHDNNAEIKLAGLYGTQRFVVPYTDEASLENITHCIICLFELQFSSDYIQSQIEKLRPVSMRLELKEGIYQTYIIDDTYNSDLQGLSMALSFLNRQKMRPRKAVILSDILQSGLSPEDLFPAIGQLLSTAGIDLFIGIGQQFCKNKHHIQVDKSYFYESTQDFLERHYMGELANSTLLVKGARPFLFERIVNRLQQKAHLTVFEINLDAITHNLNFYKSQIGNQTKIMAMVKAFAYGSGSAEIASTLQYNHVDYLGVAYPDEGVMLRQNGISLPIMVMNAPPSSYETLLTYQLEPEIFSINSMLEWLSFSSQKNDKDLPAIHLKLDTGMHRLGFIEDDYDWLSNIINQNPSLKIASIFSHLVGADEGQHTAFSQEQFNRFIRGANLLEKVLGYPVLKHILNSAGIIRFPEYKLDMVRLGIGLYGIETTGLKQKELQAAGVLKATISQIKQVSSGETVGYSRKGQVHQTSRIATVSIGYADGYDRRFGNGNGQMLVNGTLCPTIGNICMDMTMLDITGVKAKEGDTVIAMGDQLSFEQLAQSIGTIPYELFTGIGERVKRVFYKE